MSTLSGKKRVLTYTPGAPVAAGKKQRCKKVRGELVFLMPEIWDKILEMVLEQRDGTSVILLGMVNRSLRDQISTDWGLWYQLYRQWRGPLTTEQRSYQHPGNYRPLLPSVPRTVPNFRTASLSIRCND